MADGQMYFLLVKPDFALNIADREKRFKQIQTDSEFAELKQHETADIKEDR